MQHTPSRALHPVRPGVAVLRAGDDRGDVLISWFIRLAAVLAVLGVLAFDGIAVVATRLQVADAANSDAVAASDAWQQTHVAQKAYDAALSAGKPGDTIAPTSFRVDPDGTVHLQLRRTARTIVLRRWSTSAAWASVTGEGTARPSS